MIFFLIIRCAICLEDYKEGEELRFLPCTELHHFHVDCVDQWLERKKCCPLCKVNIDQKSESEEISDEGAHVEEEIDEAEGEENV